MGKESNKNQTTAPATIEEALIVIANLEQANSTAENTIAELTEKLSTSEAMVSELLDNAAVLEGRIATGKIKVKVGEQEYEVIPKFLPTLSQAAVIGTTTIPAGDAHKHPEVLAELIAKGSGFLKLVTE